MNAIPSKIIGFWFTSALFVNTLFAQSYSPTFVNFQMGGTFSEAFTTNSFTAVGIGKGNRIWAGTQYGGLYTYDPEFNIWRKSDKLTNVFINHIQADPDSGIWIGQSGTLTQSGNSNIAGGVNYFPVNSDISMSFYSVQGTTTGAFLKSRNVRSLFVDPVRGAATNAKPRVWVAQGAFTTSFTATKGGLNIGLNSTQPFFNNITAGISASAGELTNCEAIGGGDKEVWVAARPNNGKAQILRYNRFSNAFLGVIDNSNNPLLSTSFFCRAIFFDMHGQVWVGFSSGGLLVRKIDGTWAQVNFPEIFGGTSINNNAIAQDEFGNIYIGTNTGLITFKSPLYEPAAVPNMVTYYQKFTNTEGLPSNNITGLAYDKKYKRMVITSSGGVTFMKVGSPFIEGVVYDVAANADSSNLVSGYQRKIPPIGFTVNLWEGNELVESHEVINKPQFELKKAENDKNYQLEIIFRRAPANIVYKYNNVKNGTLMPPVLVPGTILKELDDFQQPLFRRCFNISLPFGFTLPAACRDGFNLLNYTVANEPFLDPAGLDEDHEKQLDNLANYLLSLKTVYKMGGQGTELNLEAYAALIEGVQYLIETAKGGKSLKDYIPADKNPKLDIGLSDDETKFYISQLKFVRESLLLSLKYWSSTLGSDPVAKGQLDKAITHIGDATDILINLFENGASRGTFEIIFAQLKKILAVQLAASEYSTEYAQGVHKEFVRETSNASKQKVSQIPYMQAFENLYSPNANSLVKYAQDTIDNRKLNIEFFNATANIAGSLSDLAESATALGLVPLGQTAAAFFKVLSIGGKVVKLGALGGSVYQGAKGFEEVVELSKMIKQKAGFEEAGPDVKEAVYGSPLKKHQTLSVNDTLLNRKARYNQTLHELNTYYQSNTWSPAPFGIAFKKLALEDSLLDRAIEQTMNGFWPYAAEANMGIGGFRNFLQVTLDSFIQKQLRYKSAFFYENMAWLHADDKTPFKADLQSFVSDISQINDSIINRLHILFEQINTAGIAAGATLNQETRLYLHNHQPGSTGTVKYAFRNYGAVALQNLRFKIRDLSGGYLLLSADSIFKGNIAPGDTVSFSFSFSSPMVDSLGKYHIAVMADNGSFTDVRGSLYIVEPGKFYSVKSGNWSNPATWSSGQVPTAGNKVFIGHEIVVDIDAVCKNLSTSSEGKLDIKPGKKLEIKE